MTQTIELVEWTLNGQTVRIPHDAMLCEKRSADAPTGSAGAYFWGGTYRYDYEFEVPLTWENKHVELELEGVMGRALVLVNNMPLASHAYGYTGFSVDLTKELKPGASTLLTVIADNSNQPNSRWYSGSGLYRSVRLVVQDKDRIVRDGVAVVTEHIHPAQIRVVTNVEGDGIPWVRIERNGQAVAGAHGIDVRIGIPHARLWSADSPELYTCHVILRNQDGAMLDEVRVPFGIRMLTWGEEGLQVNGTTVKLRGGCVHHDNGILGAMDLPQASRRKVRMLKAWGFNAIRSAHNPLSQSMLNACDEFGMYVLDEYADMWYRHKNPYDYASDFEESHMADLTAMVYKDRNHPSVIMYSIGNENAEPHEELGVLTARLLANTVRRLDPTRPVTAGVNAAILFAAGLGIDSFNGDGSDNNADASGTSNAECESGAHNGNASLAYNTYVAKMGDVMELMAGSWPVGRAVAPYLAELDIAGYNYGTRRYRPDLRRNPGRLVFGSETMPYDIVNNWRLVESDQRIIGDFMWTSWDYLGECSLAAWSDDPTPVSKPYPWLCADTGALDLLGDPTGEAALAKTMWGDPTSPLLFVRPADLPRPYTAPWRGTNSVPCWSWRGSEGNLTTVEVYTRAPIAKLYLNGRHQGTRRVRDFHADFRVRYEPGELIAVACTAEGLELGRSVLKSAEGLLDLRLTVESCDAGVAFVRVDVTDSTGTVEGSAYDEVSVRVTNGELIAFGSAAQKSTCSYVRGTFPLRYGRGLAVVRMSQGECTVSASAAGMHAELRLA
jgi:beta-galactosidase